MKALRLANSRLMRQKEQWGNMNRRQFSQGLVLSVATATVTRPALAKADVTLRRDSITAAIVQSRAADVTAMIREIDLLFQVGTKDLICFPVLPNASVFDLRLLAQKAVQYNVHIAAHLPLDDKLNLVLVTPAGEVKAGTGGHDTDIGNVALMSSADGEQAIPAESEILINIPAGPLSFAAMQALARDHDLYVLAATSVGDSFIQASGSAILGPNGETLAAAGLAWTQTVAATLPLGHYRAHHPGVRQPYRARMMS